jgi:AcrR family transcriptional regulator
MTTITSRPVGRPRAVTEQSILDAALRQMDQGGASAVSVRGIAGQVGITPNAVYTYFPNKAAVLRALVERFLGEVKHEQFVDRQLPWRQRIHAFALELRAHLVAHPGAVHLLLGGPMDGPNALALRVALSEVFTAAGRSADDAARASSVLLVYVFGSIALEVAELGLRSYPRTAETAATVAMSVSTEQFLWGLDRVLDGLEPDRRISDTKDQ